MNGYLGSLKRNYFLYQIVSKFLCLHHEYNKFSQLCVTNISAWHIVIALPFDVSVITNIGRISFTLCFPAVSQKWLNRLNSDLVTYFQKALRMKFKFSQNNANTLSQVRKMASHTTFLTALSKLHLESDNMAIKGAENPNSRERVSE